MVIRSHLHVEGLPDDGCVEISATPVHSLASVLPFANAGNGANSLVLYSAAEGQVLGTSENIGKSVFYYILHVLCFFIVSGGLGSTKRLITKTRKMRGCWRASFPRFILKKKELNSRSHLINLLKIHFVLTLQHEYSNLGFVVLLVRKRCTHIVCIFWVLVYATSL